MCVPLDSQIGSEYGFDAILADELLDAGDLDGEWVWLRILKTVEELLAKRPAPGQKIH